MKTGLMVVALVGLVSSCTALADVIIVEVGQQATKVMDGFQISSALTTLLISIVAVTVSVATFYVARDQRNIASAKIRLDLYNKRFEVYKAALDYHNAIWYGDHEMVKEVGNVFTKYFRESKFLFEEESGIYATLEKMKNSGGTVRGFMEKEQMSPNGIHDNADELKPLREASIKARDGFRDLLTQLEDQLASYINFRNASGW